MSWFSKDIKFQNKIVTLIADYEKDKPGLNEYTNNNNKNYINILGFVDYNRGVDMSSVTALVYTIRLKWGDLPIEKAKKLFELVTVVFELCGGNPRIHGNYKKTIIEINNGKITKFNKKPNQLHAIASYRCDNTLFKLYSELNLNLEESLKIMKDFYEIINNLQYKTPNNIENILLKHYSD